jgi:AraC-like DNA-binding protein
MLVAAKSREGLSITECAHFAGFADSSHFNKVFNKMFGIKPFFVLKS